MYFLFLSRDTRYLRNRLYLLASIAFSFLLPAISVNIKDSSAISYFGKIFSEIIITADSETVWPPAPAEDAGLLFKIHLAGVAFLGF